MNSPLFHTDESIAQKVGRTASVFPENNALFISNCYYTYSRLLEIATVIHSMIPVNKPHERIGIFCTNDVETYAAILAVQLYGAACVPLNKDFPKERNERLMKESGMTLLIGVFTEMAISGGAVQLVDITHVTSVKKKAPFPERKVSQEISYILFTSGSTGDPKGVPVTHRNIAAFFDHYLQHYDFKSDDRFLQTYALTFDVSVFSFFMPLLVGACCYVLPDEGVKPVKMIEQLQKHRITVLSTVPGVLYYLEKYLPEISLPALRYSLFSGDSLYHHLAVKWQKCLPEGKICNSYGPTETTIVCTSCWFDEKRSAAGSVNGIVPLGKPFEGMEFIIVDGELKETLKGELCFYGKQVIPHYLDNAQEGAFFMFGEKRFYRTGDVASVNASGDLVFHGRVDSQVKIDGYRVELGEVEKALMEITGEQCVVLCKNENNLMRLIAYISGNVREEKEMREALERKLPHYMIPKWFVPVDEFPLNMNGKTDKKRLMEFQPEKI